MFNQTRQQFRQSFFNAWNKYKTNQPLAALDQQIVDVISSHPEYYFIFENPALYADREFFPELGESNPFLHMSLHISLREQISTNRPAGITELFNQLCMKRSSYDIEHDMIECLAETLWDAQKNQSMPDQSVYLDKLKKIAG